MKLSRSEIASEKIALKFDFEWGRGGAGGDVGRGEEERGGGEEGDIGGRKKGRK